MRLQARIEDFIKECGMHSIPCSAFHFGSGYGSIDGKRYTFNWNRCTLRLSFRVVGVAGLAVSRDLDIPVATCVYCCPARAL